MSALDAVRRRQSRSSVTEAAPTHEQLLPLVAAASGVADHSSLRPWRLIELRGDARVRLGAAFVAASRARPDVKEAVKLAAKPLRASLLIAVVAVAPGELQGAGLGAGCRGGRRRAHALAPAR